MGKLSLGGRTSESSDITHGREKTTLTGEASYLVDVSDEEDDDERLYPAELAAISCLMSHQLRYDARVRYHGTIASRDPEGEIVIRSDITVSTMSVMP
jgi:hypothetical protein